MYWNKTNISQKYKRIKTLSIVEKKHEEIVTQSCIATLDDVPTTANFIIYIDSVTC